MNFYRCTLQKITKWVKSFFNSEKKDSEVTKASLSIRWEDSLAHSADDSHSINNILGPMLLSKTLPSGVQTEIKKAEPLMAKAFRKSCEWRDIISGKDGESNEEIDIQDEEKINLIFIDDKAIHWFPIVMGWAYGVYGQEAWEEVKEQSQPLKKVNMLAEQGHDCCMYYSTSPNCLIEKLENLESPLSDQRFSLSFQNQDDKEILLFDLYLFSGQTNDKENSYFKRIFTLAEELKNTFQDDTLKEDIVAIQKDIDERPKGEKYFSFLTLLPRLIAEIDPSIPIIIFSSTGRREITEKFSGYDNIITCFEKPRVLGYSNTDAQLIRSNFSKAISQAKWLIEVRDKLKLVLKSDLTQEQKQQAQQPEQEESK